MNRTATEGQPSSASASSSASEEQPAGSINKPLRSGFVHPTARSAPAARRTPAEEIAFLRSLPYEHYLRTAHWRARRNQALKLAGYKCTRCTAGRELQVHHLSYDRLGAELDSDLQVLCRGCHLGHHVNEIEQSLSVYFAVVQDVLRTEGPFEMVADLIEAVKVRCARARLEYSGGKVHTVIARMTDTRLGIEPAPRFTVHSSQSELHARGTGYEPMTRAEAAGWMAKLGAIVKSIPEVPRLTRREADSIVVIRKLRAAAVDSARRCRELERIAADATVAAVENIS